MKILLAILVILLLTGAAYIVGIYLTAGANGVREKLRKKQRRTGLWHMDEESDGEQVAVYCVEPGTGEKLLVGAAPFAAQDFDMQLELLRSEALQRLLALNSERRALR